LVVSRRGLNIDRRGALLAAKKGCATHAMVIEKRQLNYQDKK